MPAQATKPIRDVWAASIIPRRIIAGSVHDQAAVPKEKRIELPDKAICGPFASIVAHANGRKMLKELIEYNEWVYDRQFSTAEIKKYISAIEHLAEYGYLGVTHTQSICKPDIVRALREAGLNTGGLALVHSSLSAFGRIECGADAVIDAFLEVLGPRGTLLMPTFTQSAIYCDGEWITSKTYRPFNAAKLETWTGKISASFLQRSGILRSVHRTHSVVGCGPLARACLTDHRETDPPTCRRSPFAKLVDHRGKMIWFGADLATATCFHFLEDELDLIDDSIRHARFGPGEEHRSCPDVRPRHGGAQSRPEPDVVRQLRVPVLPNEQSELLIACLKRGSRTGVPPVRIHKPKAGTGGTPVLQRCACWIDRFSKRALSQVLLGALVGFTSRYFCGVTPVCR